MDRSVNDVSRNRTFGNRTIRTRKLSAKYNILPSSISRHIIARKNKKTFSKQERKPVFSPEAEIELKQCIVDLAILGFPMNNSDLGELVESYSDENEITRALNICFA